MLTNLTINNFIIIQRCSIDCEQGLTAITGETGAGKSIIINALAIATGKQFPKECQKDITQNTEITTCYNISINQAVQEILASYSIATSDELIIRRIYTPQGRTKNYLNDSLVNLNIIIEITKLLIHIHSQHENNLLSTSSMQMQLLDNYANNQKLLLQVSDACHKVNKLNHAILATKQLDTSEAQRELLNFQINELNEIALELKNFTEIEQRHKLLSQADDYKASINNLLQLLSIDDNGIINKLHLVHAELSNLSKHQVDTITQSTECINHAIINTEEANHALTSLSETLDYDPNELYELDNIINKVDKLAKKYRIPSNELTNFLHTLQTQLADLDNINFKLQHLTQEHTIALAEYNKLAAKLSTQRSLAATQLNTAVSAQLQQLDICGPLKIEVLAQPEQSISPTGYDQISYYIKTNPDQDFALLAKVASGGEISRISLAIQAVCCQQFAIPTIIFDEVDVGISGATAAIVGTLLKNISKYSQIMTITHLAQVAAQAQQHFKVAKTFINNTTVTNLISLDYDNKVQELARILGGLTITDATIANATELLTQHA